MIEKEVLGDTYKMEEEKKKDETKMQIESEGNGKAMISMHFELNFPRILTHPALQIVEDDDDDVVEEQMPSTATSQKQPQNQKAAAIDIESDDDLMVVEPEPKKSAADKGEANPLKRVSSL